ncbi:type II secretion system F family protein [Deferribacterales bacterium Es71-Z0220]|jgi:type IV pilus assembly protein PilC|uniref:type II secretion system F family protein n=1 Tax=Deferrivibrio essentukiensis TaxID=2880922 RepID=UPI001F61C868|nr:type II secretion system F family protein [Deferrivibrio essentukiensis]MBZ4671950.1 Type secretion system domain [Deferribacteraceae bacterium]MCB4204179.1 type II secretion system F family protein [Deferrivibrio essentukiensis]
MGKYLYKGKDDKGNFVDGVIEATNKEEALSTLKSRRVNVQELKYDWKHVELSFGEKITDEDLVIATRQLATMISAGLSLVKALDILASQSSKKKMRNMFEDIKNQIEQGAQFNRALQKYKRVFGDLYINMVAAGEAGGLLDNVLDRLAIYMEKAISLKRKVKAAMMYPSIVLIVAVAVVWGLLVFIIPKFKEMYEGFGGSLPALTQFTINLSEFLGSWYGGGVILAVIVIASVTISTLYKRTEKGKLVIDRMLLRIPKIGDLLRKVAVAKFSRTFGTLLNSGVPILEALDIVAKTSGNKYIEKHLIKSKSDIEQGKNIVYPLEKSGIFPPMVTQMISVGEETGALDQMLSKIADFYDDEVDRAVEGLTKMIEPMLMLVVGGSVGFIIIAMYLPIFKLGDVVQ